MKKGKRSAKRQRRTKYYLTCSDAQGDTYECMVESPTDAAARTEYREMRKSRRDLRDWRMWKIDVFGVRWLVAANEG